MHARSVPTRLPALGAALALALALAGTGCAARFTQATREAGAISLQVEHEARPRIGFGEMRGPRGMAFVLRVRRLQDAMTERITSSIDTENVGAAMIEGVREALSDASVDVRGDADVVVTLAVGWWGLLLDLPPRPEWIDMRVSIRGSHGDRRSLRTAIHCVEPAGRVPWAEAAGFGDDRPELDAFDPVSIHAEFEAAARACGAAIGARLARRLR